MASKHESESSARSSDVPNPVQIQKFLGGLDYPVAKEDIVERAKEEGADDRVLKALGELPDRQYDSPISVSREIGKLE